LTLPDLELERRLLSIESDYCRFTNQYRASSPEASAYFGKCLSDLDIWKSYPETWELMLLCVSPLHQKKGIGATLLDWGMKRATEENIPCALESFQTARGLYLRMGFQQIGEIEGLKKVLDGGETLHVMIWTPKEEASEATGTATEPVSSQSLV
jgi:GNAT superfamily N-acetyltransferase